jgi:hypothetical protein
LAQWKWPLHNSFLNTKKEQTANKINEVWNFSFIAHCKIHFQEFSSGGVIDDHCAALRICSETTLIFSGPIVQGKSRDNKDDGYNKHPEVIA